MTVLTMILAAVAAAFLLVTLRAALRRGLWSALPTAMIGLSVSMMGIACGAVTRADSTRAIEAAVMGVLGVVVVLVHRARRTPAR